MPVRAAPFPAWPNFAVDEVAAAEDVLRSGWVNYWAGDEGRAFEREFAEPVSDARAGLSVPRSLEHLAGAVMELLALDSSDRITMGKNGIAYMRTTHDTRVLATAFEKVVAAT